MYLLKFVIEFMRSKFDMCEKYLKIIISWYLRYWWLTPLTVFIIWRVVIEIVGQVAFSMTSNFISPWVNNPNPPLWARWDSGWYDSIIRYGYNLRESGKMSNVTFFPLYTLLWKVVDFFTPLKGFASALLASNILTLFSFSIFYRWVSEKWDKGVALKSLIALAVFPTSFFLISAYSESTLLFLVVSILLFSSRRRWILAAIMAGLASAARPTGILLWPLLFGLWWFDNPDKPKSRREFLALLFLPPLGLILFSVYLYFQVGNPFAWFQAQSSAGREIISPINLLWAYTKNIFTNGDYWLQHLAEMAALFFVVVLLPKLKKIHPVYVFYAILNLLPSLFSNTLTSIQRFVLIIAPLFVVVALQKRWLYVVYCIVASGLLFYSIFRFVTLQWAG
jgi:hypothetical protein